MEEPPPEGYNKLPEEGAASQTLHEGTEAGDVTAAEMALDSPPGLYRRSALLAYARRGSRIGPGSLLGARGRRRRIPFVAQSSTGNCGAACLAMVLGLHGRPMSLADVRRSCGDDSTAPRLLAAARAYGLHAQAIGVNDPGQLSALPRGAILHWGFAHWVVLDRVGWRGVRVVDPAHGPRWIDAEELDRQLTGVVLLLEPGEDFARPATGPAPGADPLSLRAQISRGLGPALGLGVVALARVTLVVAAADLFRWWTDPETARIPAMLAPLGWIAGLALTSWFGRRAEDRFWRQSTEVLTAEAVDRLFANSNPDATWHARASSRLNALWELAEDGAVSWIWALVEGGIASVALAALLVRDPSTGALAVVLVALQLAVRIVATRWEDFLATRARDAEDQAQVYLRRRLAALATLVAAGTAASAATRALMLAGVASEDRKSVV